jgi:hypothetical protein
MTNNLSPTIDMLGTLKAEIASLQADVKKLTEALGDLPAGKYEGDRFSLTVSEYETTVYDNEAIRAKCSHQLVAAHTSTRDDRRLTTKPLPKTLVRAAAQAEAV